MTDWEKQLGRRATAVERSEQQRDQDIAGARLDGHSFREIGRWAKVNHERARQICIEINGDSKTAAERMAGTQEPLGSARHVPAVEALQQLRDALPERPVSSEEKSA